MSPSKDKTRGAHRRMLRRFTDRSLAITRMVGDPDVEFVIGDWLSKMTMTLHGSGKQKNLAKGESQKLPLEERMKTAMYADTFLQCFEPAIPNLVKNGTKLAVNAGASDTELLAEVCVKMLND
jgi:hypothetical protein